MAGGGIHSGRYATINGVSAVRNWSVNDEMQPAQFVNSATSIGHGRAVGINAWTGSYSKHGGIIDYFPGIIVGFQGYEGSDTDVLSGNGQSATGNIIIDSVNIVWDWASGAVLAHQVQFSGTGPLTYSYGSAVLDATVSNPQPVGPCSILAGATAINNITQASLTITCANAPYVNSSTGTYTGRKGGVIDWQLSLTLEETQLYQGLTKGADYIITMYTDAVNNYYLKWGKLISATVQTNPETGAIVSQTVNFAMNGVVGGALGRILLPGSMTPAWGI